MKPLIVKRVHERYEELGREDVQAVPDWGKADGRFGKMKPDNDKTVSNGNKNFR